MIASLREIARALGGVVVGGQVSCPGPEHSPRDRSLSVRISADAPMGFSAGRQRSFPELAHDPASARIARAL
jgi:hypothetical protein